MGVSPSDSSGVDACAGIGPYLDQLGIVLGDEFLDVRHDTDPHERVIRQQLLQELGDDQALSAAGRDDDQGIATPSMPMLVQGINAFALIRAKGDHFFSPSMNVVFPGMA